VLVAGGVACNRRLRAEFGRRGAEEGLRALFPTPAYCTDNAVMIAGLGWEHLVEGTPEGLELDASAR
jgi:N6-L-threonylcarbamoyladenine synthase